MLFDFHSQPNRRQLRQFGFIAAIVVPTLGWLWSGGSSELTLMLFASSGVFVAASIANPNLLRPLFIGLCLVTAPIGFVVSEILLSLLFFTLFMPIGLALRICRRDALKRKWDKNCESYWEDKSQPTDVASYYRQW